MKLFKSLGLVLTLLVLVACKKNEPEIKTAGADAVNTVLENPYKDYAKAEFEIKGMTCAMGCAKAIEKKISKIDGVHFVYVDFKNELAMVEFDDKKISNSDFITTVNSVSDTYKVGDINKVEIFSKDKTEKTLKGKTLETCCSAKKEDTKKKCSEDCKAACCNKVEKV
jgi:mercuric ion binding protein